MNKAASGHFRQLLKDVDFIIAGEEVKGSLSYLPYGLAVRNRLYDIAITDLKEMGFQQVLLTDIVSNKSLGRMEKVAANARNFFAVKNTDFSMAAGHEIPFYLFIRQLLKNGSKRIEFPLQYFHFGSGYRFPKNGNFPFTMGERKSFLECYSVHATEIEAEQALEIGLDWNRRLINETLRLPSIEVIRPIITNKKFSKRTICLDTLTPIGKTVITGMVYFHDDIFSQALDVKHRNNVGNTDFVHTAHFGISENILFSYLLNASTSSRLRLLNTLSPVQVLILNAAPQSSQEDAQKLSAFLKASKIRFSVLQLAPAFLEYELKINIKKGVPLLISFTESHEQGLQIKCHFNEERHNSTLSKLMLEIPEMLETNDKMIWEDFSKRKQNGISHCVTIKEVVDCVNDGKVVSVFSADSDMQVLKLEKMIPGAEVLGFQATSEVGEDIVTQKSTDMKAFISKRL